MSKWTTDISKDLSKSKVQANTLYNYPFHYTPIVRTPFNGEKTAGEMGAAKDYYLQYNYLRIRSWQCFLESEVAQTVIKRYVNWIIGNGLKCNPEPECSILESEGIKLDTQSFLQTVESRFKVWSKSKYSTYLEMSNLNFLASEAYKTAIVGGDCLVVNRIVENKVKCEIIDGAFVQTPWLTNEFHKKAELRGNLIKDGIELTPQGKHIAYFVLNSDNTFSRIECNPNNVSKSFAYMIYGLKFRINSNRGVPLLVAVLETIKKLDRYKEATVGSAEERQKIAFFIEHGVNSTGQNPFLDKIAQSYSMGMGEAPETKSYSEYEDISSKIATSTQKQVFNMPNDATIKSLESKNELYFKDFFTTNVHSICGALEIPYEVAVMRYDSNYSASRAAIKDWEYTMQTARDRFSQQFYQPYYELWLEMEILNNKIDAPGYIQAIKKNDIMTIEAYTQCRWIGASAPQIDPLKEVNAIRRMLGDETTPLITYDRALELLNGMDFYQVMMRIDAERRLIPEMEEKENKKTKKEKEDGEED